MKRFIKVRGMVTLTLTSADTTAALQDIQEHNIILYCLEQLDFLTVRFRCASIDRKKILKICSRRGEDLHISDEQGLPVIIRQMISRPVLLSGFFLLAALTIFLPTRVLFLKVEGNTQVTSQEILFAAESCGIYFGSSRRVVRSEKMKNALLEALPQLKWAGINTSGCTGVISVRERQIPTLQTVSNGVTGIVAAVDGVITSCTVTKGNPLCVPGQAVQKGQLLVSGLDDCGICTRVTGAEGEIYADTIRDFQVRMPGFFHKRMYETDLIRQISLLIGKKRINLWKDSGILDASCGRMYAEYYITLPGGFCLPLGFGIDTQVSYEMESVRMEENSAVQWLEKIARQNISGQLVAGSILREEMTLQETNDSWLLKGKFYCREMIGRVITEEIGVTHGKTD